MRLPKSTRASFIRLALPVLALLSAGTVAAQNPPPAPVPKIVSVSPAVVSIGKTLTVRIDSLSTVGSDADIRKLVLYLNGYPLEGVVPQGAGKKELTFYLKRTEKSQEAWSALLRNASSAPRSVRVGIGFPEQREIGQPNGVAPVNVGLQAYTRRDFTLGLLIVLGTLISFVSLAWRTGIIRDRTAESIPMRERPFSLARFQMAVWFFVILGSVLYIAMVMRDLVMTEQALVLLGIGAATQLGGAMVDANRSESSTTPVIRTENIFRDLVTDASGVSIHRFQMLVWTFVVAGFFVAQVYETLAFPPLSTPVLALVGLSGGTYVIFKINENQPGAAGASPDAAKQAEGASPDAAKPPVGDEAPKKVDVGAETPLFEAPEKPVAS